MKFHWLVSLLVVITCVQLSRHQMCIDKMDSVFAQILKPHQLIGVEFMWNACFRDNSGCILAHSMGLGKTLQVLALIDMAYESEKVKRVLIVCPKSTIPTWVHEFNKWLESDENSIAKYNISTLKTVQDRYKMVSRWHKRGGVLITGYKMFCMMSGDRNYTSMHRFFKGNSGPDLAVFDEGHIMQNPKSVIYASCNKIPTPRRIILTGTPLQNNLMEYFWMVSFVRRNVLGTVAEFRSRFYEPLKNSQCDEITGVTKQFVIRRSYVLQRILQGCLQRKNNELLNDVLPPMEDYVVYVRLTDLQIQLYQEFVRICTKTRKRHFDNFYTLRKISTHPKMLQRHDAYGSWYENLLLEEERNNISISGKMIALFEIIAACEAAEDVLLVFSQSVQVLDVVEHFLKLISENTANPNKNAKLNGFSGTWVRDEDYFRLEGETSDENRAKICEIFRSTEKIEPEYAKARLLLLTTKAGGVGLNLVRANRVVILDPAWNPSTDKQSICRVYRYGQKKPITIYRILVTGTLDELVCDTQNKKLSMSRQVVDQQYLVNMPNTQIKKLYSVSNLIPPNTVNPNFPNDILLGSILQKYYSNIICNYKKHLDTEADFEVCRLTNDEKEIAWNNFQKLINRESSKSTKRHSYVTHQFIPEKRQKTTRSKHQEEEVQIFQPDSSCHDSSRPGVYMYGFRANLFPEVLGKYARNEHPSSDEDKIWGHDVPIILYELYQQMNIGNETLHDQLKAIEGELSRNGPGENVA